MLTDWFGTRLQADSLLAGLAAEGVDDARLVARDDGFVLETNANEEAIARGSVWLRSKLSPLVPLKVEGRRATSSGVVDERTRRPSTLALAEAIDPERGFDTAIASLLARLEAGDGAPGQPQLADTTDDFRAGLVRALAQAIARVRATGDVTISTLVPSRSGLTVSGAASHPGSRSGLHFLVWFRPGGERGVRPAAIVAATKELSALAWFGRALCDEPTADANVLLDGLAWKASRRPTIATRDESAMRIRIDPERCTHCGVCAEMCPEDYLDANGAPKTDDPTRCTRCYDCVDACPVDAIRPTLADDTNTLASALAHRPGWLSRLAGLPGPSFPAPFPPSFLTPSKAERPKYVLGLAVATMQEHAAVLLEDGRIVGAIEHEKLVRVRHAGWHPPDRPGVTIAVDPTLVLEEALCRRPIRALLESKGLTLDDVDVIAVNGLHGRYVGHIPFTDASAPLPKMRTGRVVYLPHHLCHAASAFRLSGLERAWVLTVDGRGDRECAALWRADEGELRPIDTLLALNDRSVGGVYEGITRLLGFGSHGQGSVMALASFGEPTYDLKRFLSLGDDGAVHVHESGIDEAFASLRRAPDEPLRQEHKNLAASLQAALESCIVEFVRRRVGDGPVDALCIAGGVALNCRMNERLRRTFHPKDIFVQPGANDAGTALGAALEAWHDVHPEPIATLTDAYLGPEFSDDEIERAIRRSGLKHRRVEAIERETASLLANGKVVCWFQGRLEFGPRALGGRSILADPRRAELHGRVNGIKERESWRPFGPSILAGHEGEWLDGAFDTRFMLFTMPVVESQRAKVPAVVHVDGTTRPQVVHEESSPRYHALISEFHRLTGVPMVLNTSFNRRGEPIVCTPDDALESFLGLGADVLAMGSFLVEPMKGERAPLPSNDALQAMPRGRRLSLRLTTKCDLDCGHCTLRDQHGRDDRSFDDALRSLADAREAGCDELVILRGEATLRSDLPKIVSAARAMGFRFVQLQTNAASLSNALTRSALLAAGVDAFEVMLLSPDEALHDELSGAPGSFRPMVTGVRALVAAGRDVLATIPVLTGNLRQLASLVSMAQKLGVKRVQFNFPRPVELVDRVVTEPVPRLAIASRAIAAAAKTASQLGLEVSTEAVPLCLLPPELRAPPDATEDFTRHRVDDLHVLHESLGAIRATQRPEPPACRTCSARARCPKTWALYFELFGTEELAPLA